MASTGPSLCGSTANKWRASISIQKYFSLTCFVFKAEVAETVEKHKLIYLSVKNFKIACKSFSAKRLSGFPLKITIKDVDPSRPFLFSKSILP
jgi:hypothetical protein